MIEQKVVQDLVTTVTPELWWIFVRFLATVAISLGIYKVINQVLAYFFLRFDKELGKNVGVVIDGKKGYITHISVRHLIIKLDQMDNDDLHSGNEILIPVTKVSQKEWEIIRRKD